MIINASKGDIEVYGDVKEFKTSIDPKNLEFITTLLSSNLYSDPEQSFIREIVSNAWDSHVEAGTTDMPVIIKFVDNLNDRSVTIRDFGTGLSTERFKEVYCNIGSSTKRESNEFIGGFGIGKYSSLACSDTVYITSYYEGTSYQYIMAKSGNSIATNLVLESPTKEKNGVEVTIRNIHSLLPYYRALDCITFFPNIFIDKNGDHDHEANHVKLRKFINFAVCNKLLRHNLLLGNVLYSCDLTLMPKDVCSILQKLEGTGIAIKFDIGEIGITPNRESIIYTSEVINRISKRVRAADAELKELASKSTNRDYTDLYDYYKLVTSNLYYDLIEDKLIKWAKPGAYHILSYDLSTTFKGIDLREDISLLRHISFLIGINVKGAVLHHKFYTRSTLPVYNLNVGRLFGEKFIICRDNIKFSRPMREFLTETYDGYTIISEPNKEAIIQYIKNELWKAHKSKNEGLILKSVYDSIINKSTRIDFETDPDYLKFKNCLPEKENAGIPTKRTILYLQGLDSYRKVSFSTILDAVKFIKGLKSGVVLLNHRGGQGNLDAIYSATRARNMNLIRASKDTINKLRSFDLSCIVDEDWLLHKDPYLNKVHTVKKYFPYGVSHNVIMGLSNLIPKYIVDEFNEIMLLLRAARNERYANIASINGKIDPYTEYICNKLTFYIRKYNDVSNLMEDVRDPYIFAAVVMKTRSFRLKYETYKEVKNSKLISILCGK